MPKRCRQSPNLESRFSKLCLAQTVETGGTSHSLNPVSLDLDMSTVSQRQGRKHLSHPEKLIIDKKWQESSRDELLDQLILLSMAWDQRTLVERFLQPYKDSPAAYLFLEDGVEVAIPQCPKLIYRIYTIYQAVETLYNVCMEDTTELTAELVQLHLVQLRTI